MHRIAFITLAVLISGCANLPASDAGHTVYPAVHHQAAPGAAVEHARVQVFPGRSERYTELARGAYGDMPRAGLLNRNEPPGRAGNGYLQDLLVTFDCDYSNPAARFPAAAVYVQLKVLNHDPRGQDYREWIWRDFVVRGVCERAQNAAR